MERSLLGILATFRDEGFTYDFATRPGGMVECGQCHVPHRADTLELHRLERLEGDSDPSEMLAVCAVSCPNCGIRGSLVLSFGPESTREDDDVLELLDDARR
jgi:hypothetical protein